MIRVLSGVEIVGFQSLNSVLVLLGVIRPSCVETQAFPRLYNYTQQVLTLCSLNFRDVTARWFCVSTDGLGTAAAGHLVSKHTGSFLHDLPIISSAT